MTQFSSILKLSNCHIRSGVVLNGLAHALAKVTWLRDCFGVVNNQTSLRYFGMHDCVVGFPEIALTICNDRVVPDVLRI